MRSRRRRGVGGWQKSLTWGVVALVALTIGAEIAAHAIVNSGFIQERLGSRLGPRFAVRVRSVGFSLVRGSLDLRGLDVRRADTASSPAGVGPRLRVAHLDMRGLDRMALLLGHSLSMSRLELDDASLLVRAHALTRSTRSRMPPQERLGRSLPRVEIGEVVLRRARLVLARDDGSALDSVSGLSGRFSDVRTGSSGRIQDGRVLFSRDVQLRVPTIHHETADGLYALDVDSLRLATGDSTLRVVRARWGPTVSQAEYARRLSRRRDYLDLSADSLAARHVDFASLVSSEHGIQAGLVRAAKVRVLVWDDKSLPAGPDTAHHRLPDGWLRSVGPPLALDTVVMESGSITYQETPEGGDSFGSVSFGQVHGTVLHLLNGRAGALRRAAGADSAASPGPTVLDASARLLGKSPMRVTVSGDLTGHSLSLHLRGGLGAMSAAALDSATVPLAGIHITSGRIDTVAFDYRMGDSAATGTVRLLYDSLGVQRVRPGETSPGLLQRIATSVMDRRIRHSNPEEPGGEPRVGRVGHLRGPHETFWAYLWRALRSGILDVIEK